MTDTSYRRRILRRSLHAFRFFNQDAVGVLPGKAWIMTVASPVFAVIATRLFTWNMHTRGSDGAVITSLGSGKLGKGPELKAF